MIEQNFLIITFGKTHSGKTTFGKMLKERLEKCVLIDNDDADLFLKEHFAEIHNDPEVRKRRSPEDPDMRLLIPQLICDYSLKNNYDVIISASHSKKVIRAQYKRISEKYHAKFIIVAFNLPDSEILERIHDTTRSTDVLNDSSSFLEAFEKQKSNLEYPISDEADYFFEVETEENIEKVIEEIVKIVKNTDV